MYKMRNPAKPKRVETSWKKGEFAGDISTIDIVCLNCRILF